MQLDIQRTPQRKALYISTAGTKDNPHLIFPLENVERGELDELIRATLEKMGITEEAEVQKIIEKAEQDYEVRLLLSRARAELRRLMEEKKKGRKLMQRGFRKWQIVSYPK